MKGFFVLSAIKYDSRVEASIQCQNCYASNTSKLIYEVSLIGREWCEKVRRKFYFNFVSQLNFILDMSS